MDTTKRQRIAFQKRFIIELCDNIKKEVLNHIDRDIPIEWTGIELRRLLAKKFEMACIGDFEGKRKKDFLNTLINTNILDVG